MRMMVDDYVKCLHSLIRRVHSDFVILKIQDFGCCDVHYELTHVLCDLKDILDIMVEKHSVKSYDDNTIYTERISMGILLEMLRTDTEKMILNILRSNLSEGNKIIENLWKALRNIYRASEANIIRECPENKK